VRLGVGQLERDGLPAHVELRAPAAHRAEGHVAARAEGERAQVVAQVRGQQRLARRDHARAARGEVADELGLGGGHPLHRAEQL
jgi:hypothetical protein